MSSKEYFIREKGIQVSIYKYLNGYRVVLIDGLGQLIDIIDISNDKIESQYLEKKVEEYNYKLF